METTYRYLKKEWQELWERKIKDKWASEAIARREYAALFVEQGDVVWATRDFKPLQFHEILIRHEKMSNKRLRPIDSNIGGWGKFIREEIVNQKHTEGRLNIQEFGTNDHGAIKKGGRGWLHKR